MTNLRRWINRRCLSDGALRSAGDNGVDRVPEVEDHLRHCARCRERMARVSANAAFVSDRLAAMAADTEDVNLAGARRRMRLRMTESDSRNRDMQGETLVSTMWRYRAARGALALMALVLLTTAFVATPMRSLADDLFDRFRVEEFEAITVRMEDFTEFQAGLLMRAFAADHERLMTAVDGLAEFESTYDHENLEGELEAFESLDEARAAYGDLKVASNLPEGYGADPQLMMSRAGAATLTVDTQSLNTIIEELRLPITAIPNAADTPQLVFEVDLPAALIAYYTAGIDGHLAVIQMESPTLVTPAGLDMDALRDEVLALPGLPEDFVAQLRDVDDWKNTLVVPVPEGAQTRDVTIGGQGGLLIEAGDFDGSEFGFAFDLGSDLSVVMWNDDGVLYVVAGTVSGDDLLEVANSLR